MSAALPTAHRAMGSGAKIIRYCGVTALIVLGILSVVETLTEGHA